jgi:hypothetical protein
LTVSSEGRGSKEIAQCHVICKFSPTIIVIWALI